jgi:plasmid maintenance system antidote protein VapI
LALIVNIKSLCSIKPNSYSIGDAITNAINNNLKISSLLEALSIHPEDFSHFIYGKNDSTGETIYLLAGSFDVSRINKRLPNLMNLLFKIDINTTNHGTCQIHQIKLNNDDGAPIFYFAVVDTNTCVLSESKNMILTSLRQTDNIYPINSGKYLRQMVDKADLRLPASLLDPLDDAIRNGLVVATRYHKGLASDTILTLVGQGGLLGTMEYRGLNQKQLEELDVLIDNDFTKIKLDAEQNVKEITQTLIELEQKTGFSISSFFGYENIEQTIKGIIFGCKIRKRILDNSLFVDMFIPWKNNHN